MRVFCDELLRKGIRITWEALGHPRQLAKLDDGFYRLLKQSGCYRILIGAESGSQTILDYINKKAAVEDILLFVKRCQEHQIIPVLSFMCGFPKSPIDDLKDTVLFINEAKRINRSTKIKLFFFTPYPGSSLYQEALQSGFQPPRSLEDWSRYTLNIRNMPYLDPDYENLAVWFTEKYFPKITGKKAISWEEDVLKEFHKSQGTSIYKQLRGVGSQLFNRGAE